MPTPSPVAVIDIDGVVADVRHRLRHLRADPPRWDAFFAAAADDPLLDVGADLARNLATRHPIVWLSGRPEQLRAVTESWLREHDLPAGPLLLRAALDYRPAAVVKLEAVRTLAASDGVAAMVDDDPAVVTALRAAGYPIVLADWVPNGRRLHAAQELDGRT